MSNMHHEKNNLARKPVSRESKLHTLGAALGLNAFGHNASKLPNNPLSIVPQNREINLEKILEELKLTETPNSRTSASSNFSLFYYNIIRCLRYGPCYIKKIKENLIKSKRNPDHYDFEEIFKRQEETLNEADLTPLSDYVNKIRALNTVTQEVIQPQDKKVGNIIHDLKRNFLETADREVVRQMYTADKHLEFFIEDIAHKLSDNLKPFLSSKADFLVDALFATIISIKGMTQNKFFPATDNYYDCYMGFDVDMVDQIESNILTQVVKDLSSMCPKDKIEEIFKILLDIHEKKPRIKEGSSLLDEKLDAIFKSQFNTTSKNLSHIVNAFQTLKHDSELNKHTDFITSLDLTEIMLPLDENLDLTKSYPIPNSKFAIYITDGNRKTILIHLDELMYHTHVLIMVPNSTLSHTARIRTQNNIYNFLFPSSDSFYLDSNGKIYTDYNNQFLPKKYSKHMDQIAQSIKTIVKQTRALIYQYWECYPLIFNQPTLDTPFLILSSPEILQIITGQNKQTEQEYETALSNLDLVFLREIDPKIADNSRVYTLRKNEPVTPTKAPDNSLNEEEAKAIILKDSGGGKFSYTWLLKRLRLIGYVTTEQRKGSHKMLLFSRDPNFPPNNTRQKVVSQRFRTNDDNAANLLFTHILPELNISPIELAEAILRKS